MQPSATNMLHFKVVGMSTSTEEVLRKLFPKAKVDVDLSTERVRVMGDNTLESVSVVNLIRKKLKLSETQVQHIPDSVERRHSVKISTPAEQEVLQTILNQQSYLSSWQYLDSTRVVILKFPLLEKENLKDLSDQIKLKIARDFFRAMSQKEESPVSSPRDKRKVGSNIIDFPKEKAVATVKRKRTVEDRAARIKKADLEEFIKKRKGSIDRRSSIAHNGLRTPSENERDNKIKSFLTDVQMPSAPVQTIRELTFEIQTCAGCVAGIKNLFIEEIKGKSKKFEVKTYSYVSDDWGVCVRAELIVDGEITREECHNVLKNFYNDSNKQIRCIEERENAEKLEVQEENKSDIPRYGDYLQRAAFNAALFIPLILMSEFILPISLIGKLVGLGVGGITFGVMWHSGKEYYLRAWAELKTWTASMYSLIALGTSCAWIYSILLILFPGFAPGAEIQFLTANMVLFFVNLGQAAKTWASEKASREVKDLNDTYVKYQPQQVDRLTEALDTNLINNFEARLEKLKYETVPYTEIKEGDVIIVKEGQRIPVEGKILNYPAMNTVSIKQENITGEERSCFKNHGEEVRSGSFLKKGDILIRAKTDGANNYLSQMLRALEEAKKKKPVISKMVDKLAVVFAPSIIALAVGAALFWGFSGYGLVFSVNIFLSVLSIACPCALSLATPISSTISLYRLLKKNICVKDPASLEAVPHVKAVVFDKTGTLTTPRVQDCFSLNDKDKEYYLDFAACVEGFAPICNHPIAQAFISACEESKFLTCEEAVKDGAGVTGRVTTPVRQDEEEDENENEDKNEKLEITVSVGTRKYIETKIREGTQRKLEELQENKTLTGEQRKQQKKLTEKLGNLIEKEYQEKEKEFEAAGLRPHYIAIDNEQCVAIVGLKHEIRPGAKEAIDALEFLGLKTYILTGDNKKAADEVAQKLGIKEENVFAGYDDPKRKVEFINQLKQAGENPFMLGDGLNDTEAVKEAAVGAAVAPWVETAALSDVIVQDLRDIATLFIIARETNNNMQQNLAISALYNITSIMIAAGVLYPFFGIFFVPSFSSAIMALPSLTVILNAISVNLQINYALETFYNEFAKSRKIPTVSKPEPGFKEKLLYSFPFRLVTVLFNSMSLFKSMEEPNNPLATPPSPEKNSSPTQNKGDRSTTPLANFVDQVDRKKQRSLSFTKMNVPPTTDIPAGSEPKNSDRKERSTFRPRRLFND